MNARDNAWQDLIYNVKLINNFVLKKNVIISNRSFNFSNISERLETVMGIRKNLHTEQLRWNDVNTFKIHYSWQSIAVSSQEEKFLNVTALTKW